MPVETVDINVTYAGGKDEYPQDEFTPGRDHFGLLDADTQGITVDRTLCRGRARFRWTYGYETIQRAAAIPERAPQPSPEWFDPTRDWTLDNDEKVNNFTFYADFIKAIKKTDIRLAYDLMDSDNAVHPRRAAHRTAQHQYGGDGHPLSRRACRTASSASLL